MAFKFDKGPKKPLLFDKNYHPIILNNIAYEEEVSSCKNKNILRFSLERAHQQFATYELYLFPEERQEDEANFLYVERFIKTILWLKGGFRLYISGSEKICHQILSAYRDGGIRDFDQAFMAKVYDHPFEVILCSENEIPKNHEISYSIGRHLDGYRIGFDAGGSDRKVSAVVNGEAIFSEEVVWHPKTQSDPKYHYEGIMDSLRRAAGKMPRIDAIGVSSAGIYIDNRVAVASLFRKVPEELFQKEIKNMFFQIQKEFNNVPLIVQNDGDVTALAGAMSMNQNQILGIAMGTSEAAGYVDHKGNLTGWLNELSFVPVDYNLDAFVDEWSQDYGVGVGYFSQDAVIKLALQAGLKFEETSSPAEKLKIVQALAKSKDKVALEIFRTIGVYLGYEIAYYARFYEISHVLILGRVTSGIGGELILETASSILKAEFKALSQKIEIHLPSEMSRRVGQSIAAASLPKINE